MKKINWFKLIIAIAICEAAGLVGAWSSFPSVKLWYPVLSKPWFTPPAWVFGPTWTLLYALMGISLYLVWQKGVNKKNIKFAVELFFLQLLANIGWSFVFFGLHSLTGALIEIIILWLLIVETVLVFYKLDKMAGKFLVPYLIWTTFASFLTYSLWRLNG